MRHQNYIWIKGRLLIVFGTIILYYNEIVSFELTLKRIKGTKFVKFYPYYDHTKTKYDLLSVAISIAEGGKMSAVYSLLNGDVKKVEHEYSGVNDYFKFSF